MKKRIIFTCLISLIIVLLFSMVFDFIVEEIAECSMYGYFIYVFICLLVIAENIYLLIKLWKNKEDLTYQDYKEQRAKKQAERLERKKQELKKKLQDLEDN